MIPLLALGGRELSEEFEARRDANCWSYGTASQYWSAVMKLYECLEMVITHGLRAREYDEARCGMFVADILRPWSKNRRLIKSRGGCSFQTRRPLHRSSTHCNTVQGKTTRRRDPFKVHLHAPEALWFQEYWDKREKTHYFFDPPEGQPVKLLVEVRDALHQVDPGLTLLSVRRGGLQDMAMQGLSEACLLRHSRHSSHASRLLQTKFCDSNGTLRESVCKPDAPLYCAHKKNRKNKGPL
jgi:hypothetical protein